MKKLKCINVHPLKGNDVAPPLVFGEEYELKDVFVEGNEEKTEHYDVGLKSHYNYVTSRVTGATLPNSGNGGIHWCSPDRFEEVK